MASARYRGRMIVNDTDYTGSFVDPNPEGVATDDLNTVAIDGHIFNVVGSGGGGVGDITNYYGVFIDTNNIIQSFVHITDTAEHIYIATEDCAVAYYIPNDTNTDVYIKLDGIIVGGQYGQYINATSGIVYMKKGQVFSYQTTYTASSGAGYTVYGLQSGDRIPALIQDAQIYSLEEKQIGVWIDGRPLYQKTFERNVTLTSGSWLTTGDSILNGKAIDAEVTKIDQISDTVPVWCEIGADGHIELLNIRNTGQITITHYTVRYFKTTDTAGSGGYQAYGMSPVIYSTKEREIGVWIDNKPLYQKTISFPANTSQTFSVNLDVQNVEHIFLVPDGCYGNDGTWTIPYITGTNYLNNIGGFFDNLGSGNTATFEFRLGQESAPYNQGGVLTFRYTKTTDSPKRTGYELLDIQENQIIVDATRYSTEEKIIGTWIDNKPLYQKTFVISSIPSNSYDYYNFASNVDKVINYQGMVIDTSSDTSMNICYVRPDNTNVQFYTQILADKRFFFRTYTSWTASAYITFYYTKTTDAVGSGGYQAYGFSPIIYSEEEREVGVWINNKPLYQKTLVFEDYTNGTYQDVSSLNIEEIVNNFGEHRLADYSYGLSFPYYENNNWYSLMTFDKNNGRYYVYCSSQMADTYKKLFITIQYTKTTDVAGSGEYNTLGIPNVHYDSNEKIVGTWFGETLYENSIDLGSITTINPNGVQIDIGSIDVKQPVNAFGIYDLVIAEAQTIPLLWYKYNGNMHFSSSTTAGCNKLILQYTKTS